MIMSHTKAAHKDYGQLLHYLHVPITCFQDFLNTTLPVFIQERVLYRKQKSDNPIQISQSCSGE